MNQVLSVPGVRIELVSLEARSIRDHGSEFLEKGLGEQLLHLL